MGSRRHWLYALVIATVATSATAAELPTVPDIWQPVFTPKLYPQWEINIGGRYFFSSGRTQTSLFGVVDAPPILVSRLTWTGLQAQAGEIFGRVDHLYSGFFIKGFAGGGAITRGNLQDEDFPTPFFFPYSSTNSEQRDGRLAYATLDFGWATNILDGVKVGFFAGYSYNYERVNAFGCVQTASNPFVCVPPFPSSVLGITERFTWNAVRLGFNGEWRFGSGWVFSADLAWLPWAWLNAADTHFLTFGTAPETAGSFSDVQVEALLRYQFVNGLSLGVGGRYWRIDSSAAQVTFPSGFTQGLSVSSQRWGAFLQGSYRFFVVN